MAQIEPIQALRYEPSVAGPLQDLVAPPYDVIDAEQRAALAARSPYNVVRIDLPEGEPDPYATAAQELARWRAVGAVVRDDEPAIWALAQDYTAPDGRALTRHGFLARVRVEEYGPGRIRPHERTHPGPKEDRLRLTRATQANLSPIFALFSDPTGATQAALAPHASGEPWGETRDDDGTVNRLWRVTDPEAIAAVQAATKPAELLIADGHHRYETARVYAEEIGGEGDHRYVLMHLVTMQDPGLTVFPTHRLVRGTVPQQHEDLANAIRRDWEVEEIGEDELVPEPATDAVRIGYMDSHLKRPFRLTLKDPAIADAALPDHAEPYRRLDTAVTEALLLKGALGITDDQIDHLDGFGYARDLDEARRLLHSGEYDAGFFMAPTPVERVQAVAEAGECMPPKSTYFFPKVPTGLLFNPLDGGR
jgi:uncharacterized protein (DUF1015 family)